VRYHPAASWSELLSSDRVSTSASSTFLSSLYPPCMYRSFFRVHARSWTRSSYRRNLALATISSGTLGFALTKQRTDTNEPSNNTPNHSLSSLVRAYAVYSMCSIPSIVEYSPHILRILLSVPVVKQITEALVRVTFFNQVCPPDIQYLLE